MSNVLNPNTSQLSPCQKKALDILLGDENVFITGGAGTGKSYLISEFLKTKSSKTFPVLASTGAAAVLVNGRTFHSFFGLGIMEGGVQATISKASKNKRVIRRLQKIEGFVLDEVSMIDGPTLRAAESICRLARNPTLSWGGLRVVAVGDFAQLPPVQNFKDKGAPRKWAFQDSSWKKSGFREVVLNTFMRSQDVDFLSILDRVRKGVVDEEVRDFLNERCSPDENSFKGTRLFPRRDATEKFNLVKLSELDTAQRIYPTTYVGKREKVEQLKKMAPIPSVLQLKNDCLIMLRQNDPKQRWVNGSLGHIREMADEFLLIELFNGRLVEIERSSFSMQDAEGEVVAAAENFPVSLAYATTIHKAQGATFDRLRVDLKRLWEPGQAYVALSRVTDSQGLQIDGWNTSSIRVDPDVRRFYEGIIN